LDTNEERNTYYFIVTKFKKDAIKPEDLEKFEANCDGVSEEEKSYWKAIIEDRKTTLRHEFNYESCLKCTLKSTNISKVGIDKDDVCISNMPQIEDVKKPMKSKRVSVNEIYNRD